MTIVRQRLRIAVMTAVTAIAAPALAQQSAPQTPVPSAANQAANAQEQPVTDALNATVQQGLETQAAITADQQAQYDLDRAAYSDAVTARTDKVGRDKAYSMRQEDAYARAMIVWRQQTAECERGILKSCKKPTPVPANY